MSFPTLPTRLDGAERAVETRAVSRRYGPAPLVLDGLDLQVPAGSVRLSASGAIVRDAGRPSPEDTAPGLLRAGSPA